MSLQTLISAARQRSGLTLRSLAEKSQTSHSTLAAYESGRTAPGVNTVSRIVAAAGFDAEYSLVKRITSSEVGPRATELEQVLALAEMFPAKHSMQLEAPIFGRVAQGV